MAELSMHIILFSLAALKSAAGLRKIEADNFRETKLLYQPDRRPDDSAHQPAHHTAGYSL